MAKQKTITPISDVKVTLIGKADKNNLQETVCTYKFKGHDVNRFICVEREKGDTNATCIDKAKKELTRLHKSGALEAYSNKYIKGATAAGGVGLTRKGIAILASASVVAAGALITGGIFIGKAISGSPFRPTVTFDAVRQGAHFGDNPTLTKVSVNVDKGAKVGDFIDSVNIPTLKNNDFKAWTLDDYEIERDYVIDKDTTFKASYASQKTTIYLEAGLDGYASLTPLTAKQASTLGINDTINVVSFTVDRGTTIEDALAKDQEWRFKPGIHLTKDGAPEYEVLGWSLDGGATYIDPTDPDEALLQKTLDEEKYTFVAGYDLKGREISDFTDYDPSTWSQVVFNSDSTKAATDKTEQTGQWDYNYSGANSNVQTLSLMVDPDKIQTLGDLRQKDATHTWYANPIGDYAGFDYWYDSHVLERTKLEDSTEFKAGEALNLSAQYNPHFVTDPWRAIVNNANLGLDNLHYVYEDDLVNDSLVGLTHDVELTPWNEANDGDALAEVRVIGEAQDYAGATLKNASKSGNENVKASDYVYTRPVALTFEFTELFGPDDWRSQTSIGSANCIYMFSDLHQRENDVINGLPNDLRNNVRSVKKFVCTSYYMGWSYDVVGVKSFSLSPSECLNTNDPAFDRELLVKGEPNVYQYYSTSTATQVREGAPVDRWLRAPYNLSSYYYIKGDRMLYNDSTYYYHYYYPSFCLGHK